MSGIFGSFRSFASQTYHHGPGYAFLNNVRTYKVKSVLKLRCEACRFSWKNGKKRVICKKQPRHKQRQK